MLDIKAIKQNFLTLNHERLSRTLNTLRASQRNAIELLPLLFHINNPDFPGFISNKTPVGISEYVPTKEAIDAGKSIVRDFKHTKRALPSYDIHALYLIGSCGTIAYSGSSDFDVWLCHRPGLSKKELDELQEKASAIEEWAETLDLEVHFFLMDAENFKKGHHIELSVESSGSAQHHLLLEEFYRTALILAGRIPIWWLVPVKEEYHYEAYIRKLFKKGIVKEHEVVDFGGMPKALADEFFGAAVWQLYKGVSSPYKSVLKLILMEVYADEFPSAELLCLQFKNAIHNNVTDIIKLDPYMMLYHKIESYLTKKGDEKRLEIVKRCFYVKVDKRLSRSDNPRRPNWGYQAMHELMASWGWNQRYLEELDSKSNWKIDKVIQENNELSYALKSSYQYLSSFARENTQLIKISSKDLNILGRKLYTALERKPGKIDFVNHGISNDVRENNLTFLPINQHNKLTWALYRNGEQARANRKPLKTAHSYLELFSWCYFNRVADSNTNIALSQHDNLAAPHETKYIYTALKKLFPDAAPTSTASEASNETQHITSAALFINIGSEPLTAFAREGKHLTTSKIDPLSYGGVCENLVMSLDLLYQTSWNEIITKRFEGEEGIIKCLDVYLSGPAPDSGIFPPPIVPSCFTPGRGHSIAERMGQLFNDINHYFKNSEDASRLHYIFRIKNDYYSIYQSNNHYKHEVIGSHKDLLTKLAEPHVHFNTYIFDRHAFHGSNALSSIYRVNRPDVIEFFYQIERHQTVIYILDERGVLFHHTAKHTDNPTLINQYVHFLAGLPNQTDNDKTNKKQIALYQIIRTEDGKIKLATRSISGATPYFKIHVRYELNENNLPIFNIKCGDDTYTTQEHGNRLFQCVAEHVAKIRQSGIQYPIHVSSLDLSKNLFKCEPNEHIQTTHYLNYKKIIEENINHAIRQQAIQEKKSSQQL